MSGMEEEFDQLADRVHIIEDRLGITSPVGPTGATGSTGPTTATTPATPATPTGPVIPTPTGPALLAAPSYQLTGNGFTLSAVVSANANVTFAYLQIAVRGPNATDTAFAPKKNMKAGDTLTLTGSNTGSQTGPYTAYVAYSLDGATWVEGPKTTFTFTAPTPSVSHETDGSSKHRIKLVNRSGLGFNQLVFRTTPQDAEAWGRSMGIDVDGYLFFVARNSWDALGTVWGKGHKDWLASGRIITTTLPIAPESEGDAMNITGANDKYKQAQRDLGKRYADAGFNTPNAAFRIGWEMNGNWYKWSCNRTGGVDAYRQSIRNFVNNMRAGGLTRATFTQCWNKGPGQTSNGLEAFAGSEWISVVGIDQYDMWGPARDAGQWEGELNKNPSAKAVAELATREGIQWSWDEGGNTHGSGSAYGQDNPYYWQAVRNTITKYQTNMAWHNAYDERGAPATLQHDFASNPQSKAKFQQLWKAR